MNAGPENTFQCRLSGVGNEMERKKIMKEKENKSKSESGCNEGRGEWRGEGGGGDGDGEGERKAREKGIGKIRARGSITWPVGRLPNFRWPGPHLHMRKTDSKTR